MCRAANNLQLAGGGPSIAMVIDGVPATLSIWVACVTDTTESEGFAKREAEEVTDSKETPVATCAAPAPAATVSEFVAVVVTVWASEATDAAREV